MFLDREADAFIFLDSSDRLAAGPVELSLDWVLLDDLESPGFNDVAGFPSPCRTALTRLRRKSLHPSGGNSSGPAAAMRGAFFVRWHLSASVNDALLSSMHSAETSTFASCRRGPAISASLR